jgi:hypothetical protein
MSGNRGDPRVLTRRPIRLCLCSIQIPLAPQQLLLPPPDLLILPPQLLLARRIRRALRGRVRGETILGRVGRRLVVEGVRGRVGVCAKGVDVRGVVEGVSVERFGAVRVCKGI